MAKRWNGVLPCRRATGRGGKAPSWECDARREGPECRRAEEAPAMPLRDGVGCGLSVRPCATAGTRPPGSVRFVSVAWECAVPSLGRQPGGARFQVALQEVQVVFRLRRPLTVLCKLGMAPTTTGRRARRQAPARPYPRCSRVSSDNQNFGGGRRARCCAAIFAGDHRPLVIPVVSEVGPIHSTTDVGPCCQRHIS